MPQNRPQLPPNPTDEQVNALLDAVPIPEDKIARGLVLVVFTLSIPYVFITEPIRSFWRGIETACNISRFTIMAILRVWRGRRDV